MVTERERAIIKSFYRSLLVLEKKLKNIPTKTKNFVLKGIDLRYLSIQNEVPSKT